MQKYWHADERVQAYVASKASGLVVDIGPGPYPFRAATEFVGRPWPGTQYEGKLHDIDLNHERLPYGDKEVDFVYCRHTLEDLDNPAWLLSEINRVAKAGYIETPSPVAECCRGVDAGDPPWRGYHHHRFILWSDKGVLKCVAKYPMIELLMLSNEDAVANQLGNAPFAWNTYHLWEGDLNYKVLHHEVDYWITRDYAEVLKSAMLAGLDNVEEFCPLTEKEEVSV